MFTIHNDADASAADLHRYERLLETAVPLATELSQLPLPSHITVRIATAKQFVAGQIEHNRILFGRAIDSLELGRVKSTMLKATARAAQATRRPMAAMFAPMVQGAIIWSAEGPELVVMPASHAESHGTDRFLTCVLAHEMTHLAQFELNPALAWAYPRCSLQDKNARRPHDDQRAPFAVIEGHAAWVQVRASMRLCGVATRERLDHEPEPTELFTRLKSESPIAGAYDLGEQFIATVHSYGGHALVERLLKDEDLLPTNRELRDPQAWLNRHQPAD
ncbi:hypothetical protein ABTY61_32315 [Kitasatospora sp. NPDC096128]|uniref:hypothetical protein n=1 Tax=Kitasatospora sp. NPDC096128 TaxID=3155547 RepID=UPI00332F30D3